MNDTTFTDITQKVEELVAAFRENSKANSHRGSDWTAGVFLADSPPRLTVLINCFDSNLLAQLAQWLSKQQYFISHNVTEASVIAVFSR